MTTLPVIPLVASANRVPLDDVRVLSLIPPMTQLNTPYPSAPYLTGFLRSVGVQAQQEDLALALALRILSPAGVATLVEQAAAVPPSRQGPSTQALVAQAQAYADTIGSTIAFLQGRDPTLAFRIAARNFLPEGPRFAQLDAYATQDDDGGDPMAWAFGSLGVQDKARHLATLYLNDLADVVKEVLDPRFEFVRYGESLASSQSSFEPLAQALAAPMTVLDAWLQDLVDAALDKHRPQVVLLSVPFPGAVYAAFRMAQTIKARHAGVVTVLGGGFVNTELRQLSEPRVFDYMDFVCLDAGERPLLALLEMIKTGGSTDGLVRTFVRDAQGQVCLMQSAQADVPFERVGTPTWDGLPLSQYLSLLDMLNPMHRLWSDGRWNKLTVAHGCYWKQCSFCDISLDYISRYEAASAGVLVDRIEAIVAQTGQTGFHFVDEAAPPKVLKALAEELLRRRVRISWWGNVRFEKTFTPQLCELLADSGCIAISGGLEVASDRLLKLMKKGVSVAQVARVTQAFAQAGVMVHAYLMYGFPTQTVQDTVDSLEYVRQLFGNGCIHSGFFHRFACTVHSPVGKDPQAYGVTLQALVHEGFAQNDVGFIDPTPCDHDRMGVALRKAIYNYMHGLGLEWDVRRWFEERVPRPSVASDVIARALG